MSNTPAILLPEANNFALAHGLQPELEEINRLTVHPKIKAASVRKARLLYLFESRGLLQDFIAQYWPAGATEAGQKKRNWYNLRRRLSDKFLAGDAMDDDDDSDEQTEETAEEQSFAFESDLRDFLANNLHTLEPGLRLYEEGGRRGVEFAIDGGRIDLLAIDRSGRPVVIELKLSRGRNQTLGQLLYYMGWVDQHLGKGKSRGMIVAREIPDGLLTATHRVLDVSLFRYSITVKAELVGNNKAI